MEKEAQNAPSAGHHASAREARSPSAAQLLPQRRKPRRRNIGIEDFAKVEMRVGQIKTAERIGRRGQIVKVDCGHRTEIRQICAGIAQYYEPEKLIGRKVAVVVNLARANSAASNPTA